MSRTNFVFLGLFAILAVNGLAKAGSLGIAPPLFRETPNARLADIQTIQPLDDDILDYRLPNHTIPIHYDVVLSTAVHSGDIKFNGTVKIDIKMDETTNQIVLHQRQLTILSASMVSRDAATGTTIALTHSYNDSDPREFLILKRSDNVDFIENTNWTITIVYSGNLRDDNGGFYLSTYQQNGSDSYLATTQFESTDARHGFPCFDEPSKRATFKISIQHNKEYNAISNMPVESLTPVSGTDDVLTVFQTTLNMPTYLIAFIVSDFVYTEGTLNNLKQRIYSRPGTENEQEWALVSGMLITQRLAEYYGIPYQFPKLDQVAVPDFAAGAMENWGLVTYREEYLLYHPQRSTINTKTNIANIIAHEYCHQWFGNQVAIAWWTYLWLKEGFATLFSYQATDDAYPEWGIWQQFHTDDYQRALSSDSGVNSRPMTHYVQTPREISALYDSISYSKAGSVLHMFQHALTDSVFREGLHIYLTENAYSSAKEENLFTAIQTAAANQGKSLRNAANIMEMMTSWSNQGGYPLVTVKRNYEDGSFTLSQKTYLANATLASDKKWFIPINYVHESDPDFRKTEAEVFIGDTPEVRIDGKVSSDDWLILNKQSTGYYRIMYDEQNWRLIIKGLKEKFHKIHPRNRAQLMHDAYSFATTDRMQHEILFELLTYLPAEDQYAPWSTANGILTGINRYLTGDSEYGEFKFFVAQMVETIYEKLGVNDIPGEQHYQPYIRSIAINLACLAELPSCIYETNQKLSNLMENQIPIEPNLQSQTYCNGVRSTTDNTYNFVFEKLMKSDDQAERRILISSLGCSQTASQIRKFVNSSIDHSNELRTQERYTILSSAYSRGEVGLLTSIEFLEEYHEEYAKLEAGFGGGSPLSNDILSMSQYVTNKNQEEKLMHLIETIGNLTDDVKATVQSRINANYAWLDKNRGPIIQWISKYNIRSGSSTITVSIVTLCLGLALTISRLF